jgi:N-methylhydantoinase A
MAIRVGIDIGGTFTDFALIDEKAACTWSHKRLTTPADPSQAVVVGLQELLGSSGHSFGDIAVVAHGTTLITNALIERKGARTGMLVTRGFADVVDIARETRYEIFDLRLRFAEPVVPKFRRAEIGERIASDGSIARPLDEAEIVANVTRLVDEQRIASLAICFLNSFRNPAHENAAEAIVRRRLPHLYVSVSSAVANANKEYERWTTNLVNAYTQPLIDVYLTNLEGELKRLGFVGSLRIMTSSGGSFDAGLARKYPVRLMESGPAAGILMAAEVAKTEGLQEILAFDMGGTTAKGAFIRDARPIKKYEMEVAREHHFRPGSGLPVRVPVIDMIEIGSGGGSIANVDRRGLVNVGPASASSVPGPACYSLGGKRPTLTDANLLLGYIDPDYFLGATMKLDPVSAAEAIDRDICAKMGSSDALGAAAGIREIACEDVVAAFRTHAAELGLDVRRSTLVAFGGSGPLIATLVARKLRIDEVIFPAGVGIFSAIGLLSSPASFENSRSLRLSLGRLEPAQIVEVFSSLRSEARLALVGMGVPAEAIQFEEILELRYRGQGHQVRIAVPDRPQTGRWASRILAGFESKYAETFSVNLPDTDVEITDWRVMATEIRMNPPSTVVRPSLDVRHYPVAKTGQIWVGNEMVQFKKLSRYDLAAGAVIEGPTLVQEVESTCVLLPGDRGTVNDRGHIHVRIAQP